MSRRVFVAAALVLAFDASAFAQGEVLIYQANALAGNVTPGDTQGFPVSISQPGSYLLSSNLSVPLGKNGIVVGTGNVSIDLNGFSILGQNLGNYGIVGGNDLMTISNGSITDFKLDGIYAAGDHPTVENVSVLNNGGYGFYGQLGQGAHIYRSRFTGNDAGGVWCSGRCRLEESTITDNGGNGAVIGGSARAYGNIITGNTYGLLCNACTIEANDISYNTMDGIYASLATAIGNNIVGNGLYGVRGNPAAVGLGHNWISNNNGSPAAAQVIGTVCWTGSC
jgi:hypothetical protein